VNKKLSLQEMCDKYIAKIYPHIVGVRVDDISLNKDGLLDVDVTLLSTIEKLNKIGVYDEYIKLMTDKSNGSVWVGYNREMDIKNIRADIKSFIKFFYNERINTLTIFLKIL
jgi:hypothetical protein